jgi:WD40 repeat protein
VTHWKGVRMNLHSVVVLASDLQDLAKAVESLGFSAVYAALILAGAIILSALVGRYTTRRVTSKDPQPPHALLRGHTGDVISLAFSPDGKLLATASNDNVVKVWDLTRLQGMALNIPPVDDALPPTTGTVGIVNRRS